MILLFEPEFVVEGIMHYINELDNQNAINDHILAELRELFPDPEPESRFSFARVVRDREEGEIGTNFYSIDIPDQRVSEHFRTLMHYSGDYVVTISGGAEAESRLYFETFYDTEHMRVYRDADLLPQAIRDELLLNGPKLDNIALTELNLDYTDYTGVTFKESFIHPSTFIGTRLICSDFSEADLRGSNFQNADLRMAILRGANLSNAILIEANLKYADLSGADLTGADLTGADLRYTTLVDTDLRGCILNGALFWGSTWGEGTRFDDDAMAGAIIEAQPDDQIVAIEAPQFYPQQQPQGVAFEIHNAFDKINMDRYMEIINTVIDDTNVEEYKRDIIGYVKWWFTEKIEELPFVNKEIKLQELESVLTKLGLSNLIRDERVQIQIGKTVDYVLLQSPAFIELYISGWLEDCAHAYEGASGLSCVKGIVERFITVNGTTLHEMCREPETACSQDQLNLLKLFIDIDLLVQQWNEEWRTKLEADPEAWSNLSNEERKADFIHFLTEKYTEADFLNDETTRLISDTATKYDYVFTNREDNDVAFGGRNKIKRKRKNKITRKKSKMHKKKITKKCILKKHIKTISNKRKNKNKTTIRKKKNKKL